MLPSDALNRLTIDRAAVNALSPTTKTLRITSGPGDVIEVKDAMAWRLAAPKVEGAKFVLTAQHQQAGGETIEVDGGRPFRNFLQVGDVDNNGTVIAGDALAVIFELNQRAFSAANGDLADPASIATWPGIYYDANGDGRVTAADALSRPPMCHMLRLRLGFIQLFRLPIGLILVNTTIDLATLRLATKAAAFNGQPWHNSASAL